MTSPNGVAFVTGAAGGMGRAICAALAERGNKVVLADRNAEGVEILAEELGPSAYPLQLDISDASAVGSCLDGLPEAFATIDILINNAGHDIGGRKRFDVGSADDWAAIVETNLIGLMRVTRAILPGMVERNRGDIIIMGSINGVRVIPDMAPYSASKAGVHMLADTIRGELAETAIRVTEMMPGLTRTGIISARYRGDEEETRRYFDQFEIAMEPEDIARCIIFALDQPSHVQVAQMMVLPVNRF